MVGGRVIFDGLPEELTKAKVDEQYQSRRFADGPDISPVQPRYIVGNEAGQLPYQCFPGRLWMKQQPQKRPEAGNWQGMGPTFLNGRGMRIDRPHSIPETLLGNTAQTFFICHQGSAVDKTRKEIERYRTMNILQTMADEIPTGRISDIR